MFLLRVKFPLLLGVVAAITELVPIIGPWVGGIAGILVTLATSPEKTLWVILLYLGVQLVENSLLVPRIQGRALGLHPIVVMLIIVTGSQLLGLWGVILGPLLVASAKDVIKYFFQEWDNLPVSEGAGELGNLRTGRAGYPGFPGLRASRARELTVAGAQTPALSGRHERARPTTTGGGALCTDAAYFYAQLPRPTATGSESVIDGRSSLVSA